jgi:hypothetical protein
MLALRRDATEVCPVNWSSLSLCISFNLIVVMHTVSIFPRVNEILTTAHKGL